MAYRKLSTKELIQLAGKIKYLDIIPVEEICDGITKFWGSAAVKAELSYADEYNDEDYNLKLSEITVFDKLGNELKRLKEGDDDEDDKFYGWKYNLDNIDSSSNDGDREVGGIEIDIQSKSVVGIPDLYIKE